MADKAEKDLDQVSDCGWIRGLDANGNPIKLNKADMVELIRASMPVATSEKNGLFGGLLYNLSFSLSTLPSSGVNEIGNHDGFSSGYGFYNNVFSSEDTYAPAGSAGLFIRLKDITSSVTLFIATSSNGQKQDELWYRADGAFCRKVV